MYLSFCEVCVDPNSSGTIGGANGAADVTSQISRKYWKRRSRCHSPAGGCDVTNIPEILEKTEPLSHAQPGGFKTGLEGFLTARVHSIMRSISALQTPPPSPNPAPAPTHPPSSMVTCTPELDLSVILSPAHGARARSRPPMPTQQRLRPTGAAGRLGDAQDCVDELLAVTVPSERDATSRAELCRRHRETKTTSKPLRVGVPPAAQPVCLDKATLNSTLALKAGLQSLQEEEFNSVKAMKETLQRSQRTKSLINTRATEVVNVSRSQPLFTSLVSVDVQEDQLISQVLQERLQVAPPPCCGAVEGPSLRSFTTNDLFWQKPLPPDERPADKKLRPLPRPAHVTFDLFRRQRVWEATP
ncbi:protein phosphatase 1 regulatory subunit 35 [Gouania willdenowi]|uniref:Protein phosphatase 1 regulatory subunit 35 C-terminal domain-containing protein n=1 Tax=Gouania willdenowi TaxID=441366 RepID=A0A8C5DL73_GOUWI|nr:protein phosphatase 1 regulatory subunit 35 [Gouania willdenowi]